MDTQVLPISDPKALATAIDILSSGGLVSFPTDTVYGLGALVFDEKAVSQLYDVKERGIEKAIPVLIGDLDQMQRVSSGVNVTSQKLAEAFWPGALTIVVPRHPSIPEAVTALATVGVRMPDFASTLVLLRLIGPLAVTSANISGQSSPSTAGGVKAQLGGRIPLILDGGVTPGGLPSTVVDCTKSEPLILREGPVTLEQILQALK
jgi:L-threonylcarbamoyladenylate synthase